MINSIWFYILLAMVSYAVGYFTYEITREHLCDGELILMEDQVYMNISEEDIENYKKYDYIILHVRRKNFNGFNEQ